MAVDIRTAESLIREGRASVPNAVKVDVEGFEEEVLEGFGKTLATPSLRVFGIEVHFGILKERGAVDAPRRIERLLRSHGFVISWPDASHVIAVRRG